MGNIGRPLSFSRLLKNTHLRRCPHPSSLRRTSKYASLLRISGALHLGIFEQSEKNGFCSKLLVSLSGVEETPRLQEQFHQWVELTRSME